MKVTVIGAGLAGSEAAWQLAKRGIAVDLYEMKSTTKTPAQQLDTMAELVCSNSLRSDRLTNAVGLTGMQQFLALRSYSECSGPFERRDARAGFAGHAGGGLCACARRRRTGG